MAVSNQRTIGANERYRAIKGVMQVATPAIAGKCAGESRKLLRVNTSTRIKANVPGSRGHWQSALNASSTVSASASHS